MPPVFAHGRLRLYLLKLLDEAPRHGYEVIRLLEERFQGRYAPSAGTVYPRLAKLEAEGLVTHATEGGRKVYSITEAGRAELRDRQGELAELELEIHESVAELAAEIREEVRGSADDLRRELRAAAKEARGGPAGARPGARKGEAADRPWTDWESGLGDREAWRLAKEEFTRAREEWKEQARRAKEESRRAKQDAQRARRQAEQAHEQTRDEVLRIKRRVQEQIQEHARHGDWPTGLLEGVNALARELGALAGTAGAAAGHEWAGPSHGARGAEAPGARGAEPGGSAGAAPAGGPAEGVEQVPEPEWARAGDAPSADPARDLDRLLDRFRDDIRDAARDNGVTQEQLREARRWLSTAAAHIGVLLRRPGG
ncbi:helix-turn-helix transcriptional regulator [Streptomyces sp. URMC 123]|uniref:PadR family transcriptional regulator n=1 Tax=Streptomyces sp. URMC 123 TaxID=3423403 RepID=UPI003F1C9B54